MKVDWRHQVAGVSGYARERVVMGGVVIGSLLLIGWSMTMRVPLVTEAQSTIAKTFELEHEVERLHSRWDPQMEARVAGEVAQAEQRLLPDVDALADWLQKVHDRARTLGFQSEHVLDDPLPALQEFRAIAIQPVRFSLSHDRNAQTFERAMAFLKSMSELSNRVDIESVTLTGEGRGVTRVDARVSVWMMKAG